MKFTAKYTKYAKAKLPWLPVFLLAWLAFFAVCNSFAGDLAVLKPADFTRHVEKFNAMEDENVTNTIPNSAAWAWMQQEIPFFDCPDPSVAEIYYFRWWSFRKHLVQTTNGWVITEFLTPVSHAGKFNTISCAAGFHLAEARWLNSPDYAGNYLAYWLRGNDGKPPAHFHKFSSWLPAAALDRARVTGDLGSLTNLLADFVEDYRVWEAERLTTNGLFWQFDVRDGMEESISGGRKVKNLRPTINSYMFANAQAIAQIARLAGDKTLAKEFDAKAVKLKQLVQTQLWNDRSQFFEVRREYGRLAGVREQLGYIPWMFNLPDADKKYSAAWLQLTNAEGFAAPAGLTTAERRHPEFRTRGVGTCEWDGAVWPFATSQTLYGLANFLRGPKSDVLSQQDYFDAFITYTRSQHANGKPYIGEYLDEVTGDWINGKNGRSRYYNHSTYADLLITGLIGLQPRADDVVEISPLLPAGAWDYFCLDGVNYHGHSLTIIWDKNGSRYQRGKGLALFVDGKEVARAKTLGKLTANLP